MQKSNFIDNDKILLINFEYIFSFIQQKFIDDCYDYGLIKDSKINHKLLDCRKILYHYTIYEICEEFIKNKIKGRRVLIIPTELQKTHEIFNFCDYNLFCKTYYAFLKKLAKMLPIVIMFKYKIPTGIFDDEELDDCEFEEFSLTLKSLMYKFENTSHTFQKLKKFVEDYSLIFLSEDYFKTLRSKQILI